jgi:hypothetical protein
MAQVIQNTGHDDMIVSLPLSGATQNYHSREFAPERIAQAPAFARSDCNGALRLFRSP